MQQTSAARALRPWIWIAGMTALSAAMLSAAMILDDPPPVRTTEAEAETRTREALFAEIQPVALANCRLERLGEPHDGGYLLCGNLLERVRAGYSYGINGNDGWGCDVSRRLGVKLHQYDCFETTVPSCPGGKTVFHAECVGPTGLVTNRRFETLERQIARNGDARKHLILKMDVEGAEWDSLLTTPPSVLQHIDQLVVEFHGTAELRYLAVLRRLKRYFLVANVHYNNYGCDPALEPFPSRAYEVLFVNRTLGVAAPSDQPEISHPLEARNAPGSPDCQEDDAQ